MKKKLLFPLVVAGAVLAVPALSSGGEIKGANALFIGEYGTKNAYIDYACKLGGQLADEGFVLLKNDGTFPLAKGSKISVCGKSSINLCRGGAGSGSGSISIPNEKAYDLQKSLTEAGFIIDSVSTNFWKNASGGRTNGNTSWSGISEVTIGETPIDKVTSNTGLMDSWAAYNDLAIQVLTREGSEGCDILTIDATDSTKYGKSSKHALEMSDNEQALYDTLKEKFNKVLIIINSSNIMECDQFQKDAKCAGILWIGNPGDVGPGAIGRILCGDVNPSGRTVDTWTRDFTKDPSFQNFSDNRQFGEELTKGNLKHAPMDTMFAADGSPMLSFGTDKNYKTHGSPRWDNQDNKVVLGGINGVKPASYVSYEEGIYVDYRYYETRYADMAKNNEQGAKDWYNGEEGVVYPFGYGLSYTTFSQEIIRVNPTAGAALNKDTDVVEVSVKVKNTGERKGKEVVQLYWKAPYINGGIEKADHVLCAFGKTKVLEPGSEEIVNLTFHLQDVANYDFMDMNKNGHKGYELDAGTYSVLLMKNAHEVIGSSDYVINETIDYTKDRFTGNEVVNRFTDRGFYSSMPGENDIEFTQMSRSDFEGTFPTHPTIEDRTVKAESRYEEFLTKEYSLLDFETETSFEYTPESAHRDEDDAINGNWMQQKTTLKKENRMQLIDLKDVDVNDPRWDEFMNEMTWDEMLKVTETNGMSSPSNNNVGKNSASEGDGPQKFNIMWWVSSPIIAATFNQELAHLQGEAIGMESQISGKSGWWGCAVNTHRSPFGGRNFEYYSADPFLMGRIAANVVGAATDRGVFAYFKHFAVNDQEKNRESGISFVNEQALREIYLKSFQMVFEEGKSLGVMGSYNRLGLMETAASYPLMTEVLRGEWGFKGSVLSDMTHSGNGSVNFNCYECVTNRVLAGCNAQLDQGGGFSDHSQAEWDDDAWEGKGAPVCKKDRTVIAWSYWYATRQAVKQHYYMALNSTCQQRGLTQVVGFNPEVIGEDNKISYKVNELIKLDVRDALVDASIDEGSEVATYDYSKSNDNVLVKKKIASIDSFELNKRVELPEKYAKFDDGVLTVAFQNVGVYRIDVIANVTFEDDTKGAIAYKYVIDVTPDFDGEFVGKVYDDVFGYQQDTPKGCSASIIAASSLVSVLAIAGAALLASKRKED